MLILLICCFSLGAVEDYSSYDTRKFIIDKNNEFHNELLSIGFT